MYSTLQRETRCTNPRTGLFRYHRPSRATSLTYIYRQVSSILLLLGSNSDLVPGLEVIAGLLYVPMSSGGKDFIAFLRKGQPRKVHWAGEPKRSSGDQSSVLEPRKSFKMWSEVVAGRCRQWTDEQLETAAVLSLVYGKVRICSLVFKTLNLTKSTVH